VYAQSIKCRRKIEEKTEHARGKREVHRSKKRHTTSKLKKVEETWSCNIPYLRQIK